MGLIFYFSIIQRLAMFLCGNMLHWSMFWPISYETCCATRCKKWNYYTKNRIHYDTDRQGDIPDDAPPDMERFDRIDDRLNRMNRQTAALEGDKLLDNQDMCELLGVTKRTLARLPPEEARHILHD